MKAILSDAQGRLGIVVLFFFAILVALIAYVTYQLQREVNEIESDKDKESSATAVVPPSKNVSPQPQQTNSDFPQEVIRKTIVVRGNDVLEHWFYQGEKVIAKQRVSNQGVIDTEGTIPEGKVKFEDSYKQTQGEEYYKDGLSHGVSMTYYQGGALKERAMYYKGKLVSKSEYFPGGRLRFEVDYADARDIPNSKEVGVGKLYWPNGFLKYEWNMTNREPVGFRKSYNQDGGLRHAAYFDEFNNIIEGQTFQKKEEPPVEVQ